MISEATARDHVERTHDLSDEEIDAAVERIVDDGRCPLCGAGWEE